VTVNALHPVTFMATKMVTEAGARPMRSVATDVNPTMRLVADDKLASVSGRYFDGQREARAHPDA
jgi:hypothetical protein